MADIVTLGDVSSSDKGSGTKLKTGGRRQYNMPKKCVTKKMKEGLSKSAAVKACYNIPARGKGEPDLRFSKDRKKSSDIKLVGKVHRDYKKLVKKHKSIKKGY